MPHLPPRPPPPTHWPVQLGRASGTGARDFYALGNSTEYDEAYAAYNPYVTGGQNAIWGQDGFSFESA